MKSLIVLCLLVLLTGCASQGSQQQDRHYQPAKGDGTGYKELALGETHYRVQFKLRGQQRATAERYALRRAAELTLQQGYDWFVVIKKTQRRLEDEPAFPARRETITQRRCGLLGCRSTRYERPNEDPFGDEVFTLVLLEIQMGRGVRPEKNSYDADTTQTII
ncbi:CC0125/CC1285 family lipoprotein [Cellvibrio fontiphilus]|uniref:Lipoprotein n=1 Tax=Cellvibrio fontiphilus TaxID=1815559 RepID=A0ABV7FDM1_9GAMM